ncbi:STAS domain-containing protein [Phytohabitans houttuyneae]|uniref:Anti-sigma factor antagonist n=1 Tax=Phytohabitans houttuyneae TaxID=1076126 RepID=A0A6V8KBV2_9ACTN|nr:anti-sigma factor antagonist [Phytohabitans houttuyneae]
MVTCVAAHLRIAVDASGPSAVVTVGGDLDYPMADTLGRTIDELLGTGPAAVVVDLAGLTFIDSTGLSVLVHAWRKGIESGTPVRLRGQPPFVAAILDITGISELFARQVSRATADPGSATA